MARVDVIAEIFDSFALIRHHYMEVIVPLVILLLFSAGARGGASFSNAFGGSSASARGSPSIFTDSLVANALSGTDFSSLLALAGGALLAFLAVILVIAIILVILHEALWLYVYQHFYGLVKKRKQMGSWQERLKRLAIKAVVIQAFWLVVVVALLAVPLYFAWSALSGLQSLTFPAILASLGATALALLAVLLVLLVLCLLLTPLWIYYAMDGLPFSKSLSRSASLVSGHLVEFLLLAVIFGLLGFGAAFAAALTCCFAYVVSPILTVFLGLLWGVTLMKVKAKLEK